MVAARLRATSRRWRESVRVALRAAFTALAVSLASAVI